VSYVTLFVGLLLLSVARAATRAPRGSRPIWVAAMTGSELAGWLAGVTFGLGSMSLAAGWLNSRRGALAGAVLMAAFVLYVVALVRGFRSRGAVAAAVKRFTGEDTPLGYSRLGATTWPVARRRGIEIQSDVAYGAHPRHILDRISHSSGGEPRPAVIYVHGGGWWRGRHSTQARPSLHRLARSGWEVFAPAYRLSPEATFPDHVIDIKRAIAWVRSQAEVLGVDPRFIAVVGGSTGGNIAALVALTQGAVELQPGFESADTSVQACIPLYGVHDMLRASGEPLWPYLATSVMKSTPQADPEQWRRASPARSVTTNRPPFFVVHGAHDTLVRPELSRALVTALGAVDGEKYGYAEVPWANHGFDFFAGPRGRIMATAMTQVLDHLYAEAT
jgi:acetyl esterase/lipase